ncbi:hypothetical protein WH47_06900, partial [Habropoda laboriosa]
EDKWVFYIHTIRTYILRTQERIYSVKSGISTPKCNIYANEFFFRIWWGPKAVMPYELLKSNKTG